MHTHPTYRLKQYAAIVLLAVATCVMPRATAQDAAPPELLAALDAPSFAEREDATDALLRDTTHAASTLARWALRAASPEAQWRLLHAASHHFIREQIQALGPGPRGALGISHRVLASTPGHDKPVVLVVDALPGFDAICKLRKGDLITAINDQPIPGPQDPRGLDAFSQLIQLQPAGTTVLVDFLRDSTPRQTRIVLTNAVALQVNFQQVPTIPLTP